MTARRRSRDIRRARRPKRWRARVEIDWAMWSMRLLAAVLIAPVVIALTR